MLMERAREYRALRAPAGDADTLVDPGWETLPGVLARNRSDLGALQYDLQGRSLADLSRSARLRLREAAICYTEQYRGVPERWRNLKADSAVPFILSGHQPELFHPGVWYKNFVLGALAQKFDAVGIHLLIDSDTCRTASIRVPTGSIEQPRVEAASYDEPAAEVPYEERMIRNSAIFSTFAERASSVIRPFVSNPMVGELWPLVMSRNSGQKNLGLRLAQGRHTLEETWDNKTLELPQSAVCQLPEFSWFVAHLLANLPRFWTAHNEALAQYRHAHRMRNRAQPVPDLDSQGEWLEAPFWIWTCDDPTRRPLFARQSGNGTVITDRNGHTIDLSLTEEGDGSHAAEQISELATAGIKLRTRALTTTLFARLVLSDLFLHGIGGAKYDQVTDEIVRLFFGFEAPEFATVSATLRLPIAGEVVTSSQISQWEQRLRELRYHPEQFVEGNGEADNGRASNVAELIASKRRWVDTPKTPQNAYERHAAIVSVNQALQPLVAPLREQVEREREELQTRRRSEAILQSREYSFCLHPREHFDRLLGDALRFRAHRIE